MDEVNGLKRKEEKKEIDKAFDFDANDHFSYVFLSTFFSTLENAYVSSSPSLSSQTKENVIDFYLEKKERRY